MGDWSFCDGRVGSRGVVPRPVSARLVERIDFSGECWVWTGAKNNHGYGMMGVGSKANGTNRREYTHRLMFELCRGPIPGGLDLDHLCRTPICANPWHLEPVTHHENMLRGKVATKKSCKNGHPFDADNTLWLKRGGRACRTCSRERMRAKRVAIKTSGRGRNNVELV